MLSARLPLHHPWAVLLLVALLSVVSSTASADHPRQLDVQFDELTVSLGSDAVTIDYEINHRHWQQLRQLDVTPRINLTVPIDGHDDTMLGENIELPRQSAQLQLDPHPALEQVQRLRIRPIAGYHSCESGDIELTGDFAELFEFRLHQGSATHRGDRPRGGDTSAWRRYQSEDAPGATPPHCSQCDSGDPPRSDRTRHQERSERRYQRDDDEYHEKWEQWAEQQQRQRSSRPRPDDSSRQQRRRSRSDDDSSGDDRAEPDAQQRAEIIEACGDATRGSSNQDECTEKARQLHADEAVETIRTCDDATRGSSSLHSCLELAGDLPAKTTDTIRTCDAVTRGSSNFESCLTISARFSKRADQSIRACDNATRGSSSFEECLSAASSYSGDATPIINSCGDSTTSSNVGDCVDDNLP